MIANVTLMICSRDNSVFNLKMPRLYSSFLTQDWQKLEARGNPRGNFQFVAMRFSLVSVLHHLVPTIAT